MTCDEWLEVLFLRRLLKTVTSSWREGKGHFFHIKTIILVCVKMWSDQLSFVIKIHSFTDLYLGD
jgi:hypothetical protein